MFFHSHQKYLLLALLLTACQSASEPKSSADVRPAASTVLPQVDTSLFETFEYTDGDTTYLMKKYYMVFLKTGPNRSQDSLTAARIQEEHLAHMSRLAEQKKICAAGPFTDGGDIQGIVVYSVSNMEEAIALTNEDPAVKAGRLTIEIHPWWAAVGTMLY